MMTLTAAEAQNLVDTKVVPPCSDSTADHERGKCTRTDAMRVLIQDAPHGRLALLKAALQHPALMEQVREWIRNKDGERITEEAIRGEVAILTAIAR